MTHPTGWCVSPHRHLPFSIDCMHCNGNDAYDDHRIVSYHTPLCHGLSLHGLPRKLLDLQPWQPYQPWQRPTWARSSRAHCIRPSLRGYQLDSPPTSRADMSSLRPHARRVNLGRSPLAAMSATATAPPSPLRSACVCVCVCVCVCSCANGQGVHGVAIARQRA